MTAAVIRADARRLPLPDASVDLVVTSPPYWSLRSYQDGGEHYEGQIGSEPTPAEYIAALLHCTREWMRVLKPSGSIFVNLGDKYSDRADGGPSSARSGRGDHAEVLPPGRSTTAMAPRKSLLGLPWRYALGCVDQLGLILRSEVIWSKPNGLPESVTDRIRRSHEQWFHLVKQPRYFAAVDEIRESHQGKPQRRLSAHMPGSLGNAARDGNWKGAMRTEVAHDGHPLGALPGSVWEIPTQPLKVPDHLAVDHFAAFPTELPRRVILGWSPPGICMACGEGRRPVIDVSDRDAFRDLPLTPSHLAKHAEGAWHDGIETSGLGRPGWRKAGSPQRVVSGYACACPEPTAPTRPAVVLDPFGGTGTTALVASVLGRRGISVDASHDYGRLARWRTTDPGERARALGLPKPPPVSDGQGRLFEVAS